MPVYTFVVVASHSELIGKTPREYNFRSKYGAVIVSVHREGEHIRSKIGSIVLKVLLLIIITNSKSININLRWEIVYYCSVKK